MFRGCFNAFMQYWIRPAAEMTVDNPLHQGVLDKLYFKKCCGVWLLTVHTGTTVYDSRPSREGAQIVFVAESIVAVLEMVVGGNRNRLYAKVFAPNGVGVSVEPSRQHQRAGKVDVLTVDREYPILSLTSRQISAMRKTLDDLKA